MAKHDIDAILNTPEEILLHEKTLYVREFTIRERIAFLSLLNSLQADVRKDFETSSPEAVFKKLSTKDLSDFQLLDFIFKTCEKNPLTGKKEFENNFTKLDFDAMTTGQVTAITDIVWTRNDFFGLKGSKKEKPEEKQK